MKLTIPRLFLCVVIQISFAYSDGFAAEPLASWNDNGARRRIVEFVQQTTEVGSPNLMPVTERIAVFDNDGTLWGEQPVYFQAMFIFDRVRKLAPQNPEWTRQEPFASVLKGDLKGALAGGERAVLELAMATHANMTSEEFSEVAKDWLATAVHPKTARPLTEMVYQPMLELLEYLRANGFKTYIVSGGGIEFLRVFAEQVYGVPPEQVIGSSIKTKYELREGQPVLIRIPELNFVDDKEGKPVAIQQHIGRRPIAAFGNSDGDLQMLQWTTAGKGKRLGVIVRHDDVKREYAYDRDSHVGKLAKALDDAEPSGWLVVSMRDDWKQIYPWSGASQR